jgi:hypothetical protein
MPEGRVELRIGPVDGDLARTWLTNSRAIVAAVRHHRFDLSIAVDDPLLDLIDAALIVWLDAATNRETFEWSSHVDVTHLVALARQWRALASLSDDDLALLGCSWADPVTLPFFDALVGAFATALKGVPETAPLGEAMEERPPGR